MDKSEKLKYNKKVPKTTGIVAFGTLFGTPEGT